MPAVILTVEIFVSRECGGMLQGDKFVNFMVSYYLDIREMGMDIMSHGISF